MRRLSSSLLLSIAFTATLVGTAAAQSSRASQFVDNCQRNRSDNEQFCETRDLALAAVRSLVVDGRENGGITVHAWDKNEIQVVGMVQARAETANEAQSIARQIVISSANGNIHADGPRSQRR